MNFAEFWMGSSGGGPTPPTPPEGTSNSLRFRGDQSLYRSFSNTSNTFTISFWTKISTADPDLAYLFSAGSNSPSLLKGQVTASGKLYNPTLSDTVTTEPRRYRDPSAWYHIMLVSDAGTESIFVNGELASVPNPGSGNFNGQFVIGRNTDLSYVGASLNGYMADWYGIDGQALLPTAFGRYNEDGVWVPREVDFTPAERRYSDMVTFNPAPAADAGGLWNAGDPTILFNGDDQQYIQTTVGAATNSIVFTPVGGIEFTTSVEIEMFNNVGETVQLNDNAAITLPAQDGTGQRVSLAQNTSGTLERITCTGISGGSPSQIWVDGNPLLNPFLYSAQVFSSDSTVIDWNTTSTAGFSISTPQGFGQNQMFDGNAASISGSNGQVDSQSWVAVWRPNPTIEVTSLRIAPNSSTPGAQFPVFINGDSSTVVTTLIGDSITTWQDVPFTGTLESIIVANSTNTADVSGWQGIEINGQVYIDGQNPSYGENGFHLTFQDPDNLGLDTSGNNNNFTASSEFNTTTMYNGDYNWSSRYVDSNTNTIPRQGGGDPYWIDLVPAPDQGDTWCSGGSSFYAWSNGKVTGPGNENGTYIYGSNALFQQEMTFDLRDFDTVHSAAIWGGWNQPDGSTTSAVISLLDENKNIIPGTSVNPVRVGNTSQREEMCNTDVGARYIKFDLSAPGSYFFLYGIEINGGLITQNVSNSDYDLMQDGPSQNYSTWQSDLPEGTLQLLDANLRTAGDGTWRATASQFRLTSGQWMWETTRSGAGGYVGIISETFGTNPTYEGTGGFPAYSVLLDMSSYSGKAVVFVNNSATPGSYTGTDYGSTSCETGSVVRTRLDIDNTRIAFDIDGVQGAWLDYSQWLDDYPIISANSALQSYNIYINYGQQPFLYPDEGYKALQTQNLPEAPIANGRDHFQAITGPGAATGGIQPTTGSWSQFLTGVVSTSSPGNAFTANNTQAVSADNGSLVWEPEGGFDYTNGFKVGMNLTPGTNAGEYRINDGPWITNPGPAMGSWAELQTGGTVVATGAGTIHKFELRQPAGQPAGYQNVGIMAMAINQGGTWVPLLDSPILTQAQNTFPNGLWWVKNLGTGNHQLVDSVRGNNLTVYSDTDNAENTYIPTNAECVAWCWNGGGAAVANTDGDIQSQVSANTAAGFSIVTYTGETGSDSIGHGLNQEPECVFTKPLNQAAWVCYFKDLGRDTWLNLNNATGNGSNDVTDYWGPETSWTNTTMGVYSSGDGNNNLNGINTVAYCWHSVPGYSAIGSYQGNSDPDGPVIVTGFRPAFVMTKSVTAAADWLILDTTRSPNNPCTEGLLPNDSMGELALTSGGVDIVSNGFKPRQAGSFINDSQTYVYLAFAENPFGGSNVSPANAR